MENSKLENMLNLALDAMNVCRLYRFVVNPRKAIIQEMKRLGTDLLTGRER